MIRYIKRFDFHTPPTKEEKRRKFIASTEWRKTDPAAIEQTQNSIEFLVRS